MSGNGSTYKRCGCTDPDTGKQLGSKCPDLEKRRHGTWCLEIRLDTTTGRRKLKRTGFAREKDASDALGSIRDLIKLAGDDAKARQKIGDLIYEKSARGGELPAVEDVRRRLGLRRENLGSSETFGEAWPTWLAGKKALRPSSAKRLGEIGDHWLIPVLKDIAADRITGEHWYCMGRLGADVHRRDRRTTQARLDLPPLQGTDC